jgi:hypothetical protein
LDTGCGEAFKDNLSEKPTAYIQVSSAEWGKYTPAAWGQLGIHTIQYMGMEPSGTFICISLSADISRSTERLNFLSARKRLLVSTYNSNVPPIKCLFNIIQNHWKDAVIH